MQRINVYRLADNTFPEIKVEKIDYLQNAILITGEVLWYDKDINTPLIEGYGQLRLIDSGNPFSKPLEYIYHPHYQLPERSEEKDSFYESLIKSDNIDETRFMPIPSHRVYSESDYYKNYWTRYFAGRPYIENRDSPFPLASMRAEGRWITFDSEHFGYVELTQLHGLFIEYDDFTKEGVNLLFETTDGHYLTFSHELRELQIEFLPLKKPE